MPLYSLRALIYTYREKSNTYLLFLDIYLIYMYFYMLLRIKEEIDMTRFILLCSYWFFGLIFGISPYALSQGNMQVAGIRGFSPNVAYAQSLAFNSTDHKVYVAFSNYAEGKFNRPASVMKFTGTGSTGWEFLGEQYCAGGFVKALDLNFSRSGQAYLAVNTMDERMDALSVYRYSLINGWETVGEGRMAWCAGTPDIRIPVIAGVETPVVAFLASDKMFSTQYEVMKYSGGVWSDIDPSTPFPNSSGSIRSSSPQVGVSGSGVVYTASIEALDKNIYVIVRSFNGQWHTLASLDLGFAVDSELSLELDPSDELPAIAFRDALGMIRVRKYDGSSWVNIGTTPGEGRNLRLSFSPAGNMPVIAFIEVTQPDRIAVKGFDGTQWSYLANPFMSEEMSGIGPYLGFTMDSFGSPYVAFQDAFYLSRSTVLYYPMVPPENLLSTYVILGAKEAQVGEGNLVNSGWVGITEKGRMAQFKQYSRLYPGFVKADAVNIHPNAYVPNVMEGPAEVSLPEMQLSSGNGKNGTIIIPNNAEQVVTAVNVDLRIGMNCKVTVIGNCYGRIDIGSGSQVLFTSPVLDLSDLVTSKGTLTRPVVISFAESTDVRVKRNVDISDFCRITPVKPDLPIAFFVGEDQRGNPGQLTIRAEGVVFRAGAFLPWGQIHLISGGSSSRPSEMTGQFIADKFNSDARNVTWNLKKIFTEGQSQMAPLASDKTELPEQETELRLFPSPCRGEFRLSSTGATEGTVSVSVMNLLGDLVYQKSGIPGGLLSSTVFDLKSQPDGLYTVTVLNGGKKIIRKMIIVK